MGDPKAPRFDIRCGERDHATRRNLPGFDDGVQGTTTSAEAAKSYLCTACADAIKAAALVVDDSRDATALAVRTKLAQAAGVNPADLDTVLPPPAKAGRVASVVAGLVAGAALALAGGELIANDGSKTPAPITSPDAGLQEK